MHGKTIKHDLKKKIYYYYYFFAIDNVFYYNSLKIYYRTKFNMTTYFENLIVDCKFFMFLTHISNFILIGCYLLLNP